MAHILANGLAGDVTADLKDPDEAIENWLAQTAKHLIVHLDPVTEAKVWNLRRARTDAHRARLKPCVAKIGDRICMLGGEAPQCGRANVGNADRIPADIGIGQERVHCRCTDYGYATPMNQRSLSNRPSRTRALVALRAAFAHQRPDILIDNKGYAPDFRDTLLPLVATKDFEADLQAGDGNELKTKFRAAHSSSGLAVNCFAPFRTRIDDLGMPNSGPFTALQFERKCPTGLRGGRAPNLDVVLSGPKGVIGIESKLTEFLTRHRAAFSPAYAEQIRDARREQGYFREMLRLIEAPDSYVWLDAAQLIKHSFGLARSFRDQPVTLLYLYWEPANPDASPEIAAHRSELDAFADRVAGSTPEFRAMSYPELWRAWDAAGPAEWLTRHLDALRARYEVIL